MQYRPFFSDLEKAISMQPVRPALLITTSLLLLNVACSQQKTDQASTSLPDYSRQLPPGDSALIKVTDPSKLPSLKDAWAAKDVYLLESCDASRRWFQAPSSQSHFPYEGITHEQAQASVVAFQTILENARNSAVFETEILDTFDVYVSRGCDDDGTVLFTGYFSPIFRASQQPSAEYPYPLYTRPADLVTDPTTGQPKGQQQSNGSVTPYPTRQEIESSGMLKGTELVWLQDPLSTYLVHVNGSAKLLMPDNTTMYVGYAGKTDRPYKGLGRSVLDAGLVGRNQLSLATIRRLYRQDPETISKLINKNECYVFFTEYAGGNWPAGSLGVPVNQRASIATDKTVYPRGGVVMVDTQAVTIDRKREPLVRFMLDQDTGGAIKAPGRADIFMGIGPSAEVLAGGQFAEGKLYYFFLKPDHIAQYAPANKTRTTAAQ